MTDRDRPLVLVSNRGPVTYQEDGSVKRGTGGLVTALTRLASHPDADSIAYDGFYNVIANPMLWFIQHYLWDQSNAPDIRRQEVEAFEHGYNVVNDDLAQVVLDEIEGAEEPVVMVHDSQLYSLP